MEAVRATAEGAIAMETKQVKAFGTEAADALLQQLNIQRRNATPHDVEIEILYCGVCHSDIHIARNEWDGTRVAAEETFLQNCTVGSGKPSSLRIYDSDS